MKLEVGKSYVNRDGGVRTIIKQDPDTDCFQFSDGDRWYMQSGRWGTDYSEFPYDLIAEAPEAKDTPDDAEPQPDDGGPAFPVTPTDRSGQIEATQWGMSLREWYAGMSLAGLRSSSHAWKELIRDDLIRAAWDDADEMIKASRK